MDSFVRRQCLSGVGKNTLKQQGDCGEECNVLCSVIISFTRKQTVHVIDQRQGGSGGVVRETLKVGGGNL